MNLQNTVRKLVEWGLLAAGSNAVTQTKGITANVTGNVTVPVGSTLSVYGGRGAFIPGGKIDVASGKAVTANRVIPLTHSVVSKTTGDTAETLTLADGTPGQIITIVLAVDGGGDGDLTPATKTGFATVALDDAGDQVTLQFIDATVGWVILGAAGIAAPPAITV